MIRNAFAFAVALACVPLLIWETKARERQKKSEASFCLSDMVLEGTDLPLSVLCRDVPKEDNV